MSKQIYIVFGRTGAWEDIEEWIVKAYTDIFKARAHVELANVRAKEIMVQYEVIRDKWLSDESEDAYSVLEEGLEKLLQMNEYDSEMRLDTYSGTGYDVRGPVELEE